jgi:8-oxo-dGTP pyrophosphatase MutT (NUDIX family)
VAGRSLNPEEAPPVVRAAGGVVWRRTGSGLEVLLIHRPRYDDWSLPKGKADPDEDDVDTAAREVREETGLEGVLGPELARIRYNDRNGRPKVVRYWSMTVAEPAPTAFSPNGEVDELAWLPLAEATARLSYPRDRTVLDALVASLTGDPGASRPDPM